MESMKVTKLKRELLGLDTEIKKAEDKLKEELEKKLKILKDCRETLVEEIKKAEIEAIENEIKTVTEQLNKSKSLPSSKENDKDIKKFSNGLEKLKEKLESKKNPKPRGKKTENK